MKQLGRVHTSDLQDLENLLTMSPRMISIMLGHWGSSQVTGILSLLGLSVMAIYLSIHNADPLQRRENSGGCY